VAERATDIAADQIDHPRDRGRKPLNAQLVIDEYRADASARQQAKFPTSPPPAKSALSSAGRGVPSLGSLRFTDGAAARAPQVRSYTVASSRASWPCFDHDT